MGKIKQSLEAAQPKRCAYFKIFVGLDEEDKEAIYHAIGEGKGAYVIASALRDGGYKIAHSTVGLHLDGRCICE